MKKGGIGTVLGMNRSLFQQLPSVEVKITDARFPEMLRHIPDPPLSIWVKGDLRSLHSSLLTVVGTRKMTEYGRQAVRTLLRLPIAQGITIVSGMALGIDGEAHRCAVDFGGKTVAVLAQGLSEAYPRSHARLADEILEHGGAILSEFADSRPAEKYLFLRRNRILAGLSRGTLVIEAGVPSGSLITARLAADCGRTVMAVPGPFSSAFGEGVKQLLNGGAELVTSGQDVLQACRFQEISANVEVNKAHCSEFNGELTIVVSVLQAMGAADVSQLESATGIEHAKLSIALIDLELKGVVERTFAGYHLRTV